MLEFMRLPGWAQDGVSEQGSGSGYWKGRTTQTMITIRCLPLSTLQCANIVYMHHLVESLQLPYEPYGGRHFSDEVPGLEKVKWHGPGAGEGAGLGLSE